MIMSIGKMKYLIFIFLFSTTIPSVASNSKCDENNPELYDSFGTIIKEWSDSSAIFRNKKGKEYKVVMNDVYYKDGEVALKNFIYKNTEKEYECNVREVFVILFGKNLEIEEVRIADVGIKTEPYDCEHKRDFINAIKKTKGLWMKKGKKRKKHVYVFSLHIH